MEFKKSEIYAAGKFYERLGKLLQNPKATISEIVEFCFLNGQTLDFRIFSLPEQEKEE